ncbi:MAG: right-handed parallel beta-helix repeat-containing protein [Planctomycetota bacterium]|jgi:hypothetical protein
MRIASACAACWLLVLWQASTTLARDIYVDNFAGDDAFTGQQPRSMSDMSGPVRSINRALKLARQGDRIVLKNTGEPYRESISVVGSRHSGYSARPLIIEGNGAILDGSAPVPAEAWEHYRGPVFRFRPPRLAYQQLFQNDRPVDRVIASRESDDPPPLGPLQWCLFRGHVYFSVDPDSTDLPRGHALTHTHRRVGITLFHVDRVAIANLTVQGFQLDGINACNSAREITLSGVTCRGNGRSGITVGGASQVRIDACLVGDNGEAQLTTLPCSETQITNTALLANTAPGWVDRGGRVYVEGKRVEGGLEELAPPLDATATPPQQP